jgi:hypothetical protein
MNAGPALFEPCCTWASPRNTCYCHSSPGELISTLPVTTLFLSHKKQPREISPVCRVGECMLLKSLVVLLLTLTGAPVGLYIKPAFMWLRPFRFVLVLLPLAWWRFRICCRIQSDAHLVLLLWLCLPLWVFWRMSSKVLLPSKHFLELRSNSKCFTKNRYDQG